MTHFRDPTRLGRWCVVLLFVWLAVDVVYAATSLYTADALGAFADAVDVGQAERADAIMALVGGAFALSFLVSSVLILRWIFVTTRNAHAFSDGVEITLGWAVGWFFVPVATLWKPFQAFSSVWRASVAPEDPDAVEVPARLRLWWGLWLATAILGNLSFRLALKDDTGSLIASCLIDGFVILIDVPLVLVLRGIIVDLSAMQRGRAP